VSDFDPRAFVKRLPDRPGVYRMLDADGKIIYVGKARSLKSRVASYFRADQLQPKAQALARAVAASRSRSRTPTSRRSCSSTT